MESQQAPAVTTPHDLLSTPRHILDSIRDAFLFLDVQRRILYANEAAGRLLGASPEALHGGELRSHLPDEAGRYARQLREAEASGKDSVRFETHFPVLGTWLETRVYRNPRGLALLIADITPAKEAQALRLGEERFEAALAGAPVILFTQDTALRCTWMHRPPTAEAAAARLVADADGSPEAGALAALKREVMGTGRGVRQEAALGAAGAYRHVDLTLEPLRDAAGRIVGVAGAAVDVTASRSAEADLRRREARLALAQTVAGIGSWEWDVAGNRLEWSDEQFRMLGLEPGELEPSYERLFEFILLDDRERLQRTMRQAIATGGEVRQEVRIRRADGALRLWQIRAQVIYDEQGRPARLLGTCQDITERKRAERALRDSEERYRRLVELSPDATFVVSQGRIAYANAASLRMFGVTEAKAILGRSPLEFVDPSARAAVARKLQRVIRSNRPVGPVEEQWRRSDGRLMELEVAAAPLPWEAASAVQVILRDITERKRTQRALAEADRRKDEFIAMLAHELRNPMTPIRNAALLLRARTLPASQQQWAADVIERQVEHMRRLVDDLLDVARITRGRLELKKSQVDLGEVIQRALESARGEIEERNHQLKVSLPDTPVRLHADPARLIQALANLLHNAAKYTEPGGRIALAVEPDAHEVRVRVRDTGVGIAAEALEHIFEPFSQSEQSLARSNGGLGLGLTLVKRLVELHGGRVWACSEGPGRGSEFFLTLPRDADEDVLSGQDEPQPQQPKYRVLVVEDNPDVARSFALLLNAMGHEVQTASSGIEGLDAVNRVQPQVVFLDIGLPDIDGYEVARRLRQNHPRGELLLVALTGYGQRENDPRAREAGFDHYLLKPGDMETIERLLGGG